MRKLNEKQRLFCEYLINPDSETFGIQAASYKKAYKCKNEVAGPNAIENLIRPYVKVELDRLRDKYRGEVVKKADYDKAFIRQECQNLLDDCKDSDSGKYTDRAAANAVLRTMAQTEAMLTDRIETDTGQQDELDKSQESEAKEIAGLRLMKGVG